MFRRITLSVLALALIGTTGCKWPWSDDVPETNRETHEKFVAASNEMTRLRMEERAILALARDHLTQNNQVEFDKNMELLRANLELQLAACNRAHDSTANKSLRDVIETEREWVEKDLEFFDNRVRAMREAREVGVWISATAR